MGRFYQYIAQVAADRVAPVVRGRSVLEMGCGDGYLTAKLAKEARRVFAFDLSERAIAFARMIVREPNVAFEIGRAQDVTKMADEMDGHVEVVASFEVVEHLSERERTAFLAGVLEVLGPARGALILTTPNGARRRGHRMNPHHEQEFTPDELRDLLVEVGFCDVRIQGLYLQPPWPRRLEHVADTVPFRAGFHALARAGASRPEWCRTLVCVSTAG
jgi:2-polyprenyl-3-methyl-5-hydroxy-6-metoxy-1,4-benzoquinol methylase